MKRLDVALIARHPELSRRQARAAIEKGQVSVNGAVSAEAGSLVDEKAQVEWDRNRKARPRLRPPVPILFGDEELLVADKPAGLLSVPTSPDAEHEDTVLRRLLAYAKVAPPRRGYVGVVHRLDRDTSGALAFALTRDMRAALRVLFREHRMERRYVAIVRGEPRGPSGVVDIPVHEGYEGGRRRLARPGEPSLPALTRWSVKETLRGAALVEVQLETGRQHQIRLHLAHLGLPVLGDPVYGAEAGGPVAAPRQMLHARLLAFEHPSSGDFVRAESPLPADFERVLQKLRRSPLR